VQVDLAVVENIFLHKEVRVFGLINITSRSVKLCFVLLLLPQGISWFLFFIKWIGKRSILVRWCNYICSIVLWTSLVFVTYSGSKRNELKLPYVCLECSNHMYNQQYGKQFTMLWLQHLQSISHAKWPLDLKKITEQVASQRLF
jgi:hypothetical protein